jgi:nicotinamide riboside kinase
MTIKIAISGTHSTGKTTLCNELYDIATESGLNPCLLNEAARIVFAEHGCSPVGLPRDELAIIQREIFLKQLQMEDEAEAADYDLIICDRTLMDSIVYARFYGVGGGMHKTFYRIARHHLTTYDYIAVTKIDPIIADGVMMDGLRDADRDFWYTIERGIHEAVKPNISVDGLRSVMRGIVV